MINVERDLKEALQHFLLLLSLERYFDAHEVLEEVWHPMRRANHPLKNLVKGLINASIAFEHLKRNRANAALKALQVMASYERYKHLSHTGMIHQELFDNAIQKIETIKRKYLFFKKSMI